MLGGRFIFLGAALALLSFGFGHLALGGSPPIGGGGSCTGMTNDEGFQGQQSSMNNGLYTCSAGIFVPEALIIGSKSQDGTSLTCIAGTAGAIRYNSSTGTIEICNGTLWKLLVATTTTATDDLPDTFSFTNLTNQSLGAMVVSNTITITGINGSVLASATGSGSPQISINGGSWVSSGGLDSGDTIQVRQVTSPAVSTTRTATVNVGSGSSNWTVTTRAGQLMIFATTALYSVGGVGSLANADSLCQSQASLLGYGGAYKAILSDDSTNAKDRLTLAYPIVRATDGTTVVASSNLFGADLTNSIEIAGGTAKYTWGGTKSDGTIDTGHTCSSWTSSAGTTLIGRTDQVTNARTSNDTSWIGNDYYTTYYDCSLNRALYCIQQ